MIVAILKLCSHLLELLLLKLGLILKLPLNFFQIDFQLLLGCLKVLLLLLNVRLLSVYDFLETSHRVQELLRQIDQRLAILPPKVFKYLSCLNLDMLRLVRLQLLM